MNTEVERKIIAILRILSEERERVGAIIISRRLKEYGIDLTERAVRYHLKLMDERGLTQGKEKEGRVITPKGLEELRNALVADKIGMVITKIETLSYLTSLDLDKKEGRVSLNLSFIPIKSFQKALNAMKEVFKAKLALSDLVMVAEAGQKVGDVEIPEGQVGFGTVCSVTVNGVLVKAGVPVDSKFAAVLQMENKVPLRFTDLITYEGSSLDPLEIFIHSKMTSVRDVARHGSGKILASFREVPSMAQDKVKEIVEKLKDAGIYGVLIIGKPGQAVLEMPVGLNRVGMVIVGGLNPLAILEEAEITVNNHAMSTLIDFSELQSYWDLVKKLS